MVTVSILCWLFYGQSIVGGEWIFGPFEAKGIAYALLFFSLNGFMRQNGIILPSILLGLAFSFHPLVGLWGALAVGLPLLVLRYPFHALIKCGAYTALFALPGLIPLLLAPEDSGPTASGAWKFVSLVVMPYHFDPFSFAPWKLALLGMLLGFSWFHFRSDGQHHALRLLMAFQVFLGLFFILGFLARLTENYAILRLMPFRLFPVLLPLFFFFHLMSTLQHCRSIRAGKGLVAAGLLALVAIGIPSKLFLDHRKMAYQDNEWIEQEKDIREAFKWIAKNTSTDAIVILPPWRKDSFYFSKRAQIANWWVLRFDRLTEWRERLESLAGDLSGVKDGTEKAKMTQTIHHYNHLTATEIGTLVDRYGAEYLVSSTTYNYPTLLNARTYKVYSLKRDGPSARQR